MSDPNPTYFKDTEKNAQVAEADGGWHDGASSVDTITALVLEDKKHDIQLRTMSWQKAAALLCGDQVCLAIMAQSWSLSVLGW
jgi:hypothetical protein